MLAFRSSVEVYLQSRTKNANSQTPPFRGTANLLSPSNPRLHQVKELRRQEGMDPPIPLNTLETLQAAEADLRLLIFKYSVLAAAIVKRPAGAATEGGVDGNPGKGVINAAAGGRGGCGLSEEDVRGFLDQHVRYKKLAPKHELAKMILEQCQVLVCGFPSLGLGSRLLDRILED